ncbi:hypothetical protein [Sinorhizobium meliloti]|nr:hypothetical protein [Sinorhizobium meliloti]
MSSFFSADQIEAMSGAVVRCDLLVEMAFRSENDTGLEWQYRAYSRR